MSLTTSNNAWIATALRGFALAFLPWAVSECMFPYHHLTKLFLDEKYLEDLDRETKGDERAKFERLRPAVSVCRWLGQTDFFLTAYIYYGADQMAEMGPLAFAIGLVFFVDFTWTKFNVLKDGVIRHAVTVPVQVFDVTMSALLLWGAKKWPFA